MSEASRPRVPKSTWIVGAVLAFVCLGFAASSGMPGILIGAGCIALLTGLYTVSSGRRSWALLPSRKIAGIVAATGLVTIMMGGALNAPQVISQGPEALATSTPVETRSATPAAKPTPAITPVASPSPSAPNPATAPVPLVSQPDATAAPPAKPVAPSPPAPPPEAPPAPPPAPAPPPEPSVYYKNCDAVRAAGKAPIYLGQPGYAKHLDRDGDGVGCE